MSEVTFIKGKDESLENSIRLMQSSLSDAGFKIDEVKWLNPAENIYSLHIHDQVCPGLFTNGKGASRKATLASALGEFLERLSTNYFFSDYYLQANQDHQAWLYYPNDRNFKLADFRECLNEKIWQVYDPHKEWSAEHLLSFNDDDLLIRTIEMRHAETDQVAYFPMNVLSNLYASNGLSAGNTFEEAHVQGLSEIFERWVKNQILIHNYALPKVPDEVVERFPTVQRAIKSLKEHGLEVSVRDASLGGRFPVMNVTLFDPANGRCFASFGAHPIFEVALERTLTESLQGRHLDFLDGFQVPVFDEFAVAEAENLENHFIDSSGLIHARFISDEQDFEFVDWNWELSTADQWQYLLKCVKELGFEVYVADYQHYGLKTCRIVVPGMSEVYPLDELLVKNQNDGRKLRQALDHFADGGDASTVIELLDEIGFSDHQGIASLIGLMPDPGSEWSDFKIVDLRFWMELAHQDWQAAYETLQSAKIYVHPQKPMAKVYEAFNFALEVELNNFDWGVYRPGMWQLFGQQTMDKIERHLKGEAVAWGVPLGQAAFDHSLRHQALLEVYQRTRQVKEAYFR